MLDYNSALDAIDEYGTDLDLWPSADRAQIEALMASDDEIRDYYNDAKYIDDLLDSWQDGEDGADVWGEDSEFSGGHGSDHESEETDRDDPFECESVDGPDGLDNDEPKDSGGDDDQPQEPYDGMPVFLDPEALKDMDDMFTDAIRIQAASDQSGQYRVFTRDFDDMVDIAVNDGTTVGAIDRAVAATTGPLQKDLRRMIAARSQVRRMPGMRRGKVHAANLHRVIVGDDRVFSKREEAPSLDTAMSLVIDCSGSMTGHRMKIATEAGYAVASVLNRIGITFECLGFTDNDGDKRTKTAQYRAELHTAMQSVPYDRGIPLIMPKFKTFDEPWNLQTQRRFAQMHHGRGSGFQMSMTPEGCGVEFAARRLLARKEKRKIMLVMTDGQPGGARLYGGQGSCSQHAASTVARVAAAGVDIVGIGICHSGPTKYYPHSLVINEIEDLPAALMRTLKKLIV